MPAATHRVALRLGPGPARNIVAALLKGSRFHYLLLGSPTRPGELTRVELSPRSYEPGVFGSKNNPATVQSSPPHQNPTAKEPSPESDGMPELQENQP
jgi:hypothetical protein